MKKLVFSMISAFLLIPWGVVSAQSCYEFSSATEASAVTVPFSSSFAFSWTQMIFTPAKVGGTGTIYSVSFKIAEYAALVDSSLVIYMGTTADTVAATTSSWVPEASLTEVFRSSHYEHGNYVGWETFTLSTPFAYDGTSSLVICISSKHIGTNSNHKYVYVTSPSGASMTRASSTEPYSQYPTGVTGSRQTALPATTFCFTGGCTAPKSPVVSNIAANSADIAWTASGYSETGYQYLCLSDTAEVDWTNAQTTTATSVTVSGLNPNSIYYFYVRSACGASGYSNAVMTSFRSGCSATTTIPYLENFDNQLTGSANVTSAPQFVSCWTRVNDATEVASQGYPYINNGSTNQRSGEGKCLYFIQPASNADAASPAHNVAVLPQVTTPINTLQLSFWAKKSVATAPGLLVVGVMTDPTDLTTFVSVDTVKYDKSNNVYTKNKVFFNRYQGLGQYMAIMCPKNIEGATTTAINFYVDDVEVDYLPSCMLPKTPEIGDMTANSAEISWSYNGNETQWQLQYKESDSLAWIDYPANLTVNNLTLTGLTGNTSYDVRVRAYCSATEQSEWTNVTSFITDCEQYVTIPFYANFDNEESGGANGTTYPNFVHCWSRLTDATNAGYTGYPYVSSTARYQRSGSGKIIFFTQYPFGYATSFPTYQMAILPSVDPMMDPVNTLQLSFWAKKSSTTMPGRLVVGVIADPSDYTTFEAVDTIDITTLTDNQYHEYTVYFNKYEGEGSYVAIMVPRNISATKSQTSDFYIDDIVLDYAPTCDPVAVEDLGVISFEEAEGFEAGEGKMKFCWTVGNLQSASSTVIPYVLNGATTANTGANALMIYAYTSSTSANDSSYVVMPAINFTDALASYDMEFYMRKAGNSNASNNYNDTLFVGIMSDPDDFSTFQQVGYAVNTTQTYQKMTVPFKNSSASEGYVAFLAKSDLNATTSYKRAKFNVDDITFVQHKYEIAVHSNDETMGTVSLTADSLPLGQIDTLVATAAANHHFIGWSNGETNDTLFYTVTGDTAFTAYFAIDSFMVSQAVTGAEYGVVNNDANVGTEPQGYPYGTVINFSAVPNVNADFLGWSDATTALTTTYTVIADTVIGATFAAHLYTISASANDDAMGSVSLSATSLPIGETDTIVATAAANHHFIGWSNGETNDTLFYTVTGDATFTANFAIDSFMVSQAVTGAEYGVVNNDANVGTEPQGYPYGTVINFSAVPNVNADFLGWSDATTALTTTYTVTADTVIGATFAAHLYTISASANDDAMGSVSVSAGSAYYGDTILIVATSNIGFTFVDWSNGDVTDSIYVRVESDTSLTANFDYVRYNVSVLSADSTMGVVIDVTELPEYHYGDVATFKAVANDGYEFVNWSNGEAQDEISLTITSDTVVNAIFRIIITGIDNANQTEYIVYTEARNIVLHGAAEQRAICYDASGRVVADVKRASEDQHFTVDMPGVYMIYVNGITISVVVK